MLSFFQTATLTCPACKHTFQAEIWIIVDAAERPDLLDQACEHLRRAQELRPRKARNRRNIEQALRKYCP